MDDLTNRPERPPDKNETVPGGEHRSGLDNKSTTRRLTFYTQAGGRGLTPHPLPCAHPQCLTAAPHTECRLARRNRHRSDGLLGKNFVGLPRYLLE